LVFADHGQSLVSVVGNVTIATEPRQQHVKDIPNRGFILDDQNLSARRI
jgi:hypothetical protein